MRSSNWIEILNSPCFTHKNVLAVEPTDLEGFSNAIAMMDQCLTRVRWRSDNASSISSLGNGCPNLKESFKQAIMRIT